MLLSSLNANFLKEFLKIQDDNYPRMAFFFKNEQFPLSKIKEIMVLGKPLDKFGKQNKTKILA